MDKYLYVCVSPCMCLYLQISKCMYISANNYSYIFKYIWINLSMYIYIYIYTCFRIFVYEALWAQVQHRQHTWQHAFHAALGAHCARISRRGSWESKSKNRYTSRFVRVILAQGPC